MDGVAAVQKLMPGVGQQGGMLNLPLGEIEVGGLLCVALVVDLEPDGPFAGAFAGEESGSQVAQM